MSQETILYREEGPVGTLTPDRPDDGNMFTAAMCHEAHDGIELVRRETCVHAWALEIAEHGPFALAPIKGAFNARHDGVSGLARLSHDLLLRRYLESAEPKEPSAAFAERRPPDAAEFGC